MRHLHTGKREGGREADSAKGEKGGSKRWDIGSKVHVEERRCIFLRRPRKSRRRATENKDGMASLALAGSWEFWQSHDQGDHVMAGG